MAEVVWEGLTEFQNWLRTQPDATVKDVEAALYIEGERIMGIAKERTPKKFGNLKASGHVKTPTTKGGKTEVVLAYGTDYAIYVHEILTAKHDVGQAKYLESAALDEAPKLVGRLKQRVLDRMGRR